ncbi:hypothetical protein PYCC9005_001433 [Savitreella phatthalungensis]
MSVNEIYAAEDPRFVHFASRRSVVHSTGGMVASTQPLANEAGYKVLARGGNAADAAVAIAAALNVTEPSSTGIGGDMFCLYYDASSRKISALNGSGRAPAGLTLGKVRELGISGTEFPAENINAVTVPGACMGWFDTLKLFGSGKLSMAEVLEPAINLAERGFPVSEISAFQWQHSESLIKRASPNADEILSKVNPGKAPAAGELMHNPTLASTFRDISQHGPKVFYKGRIAEAIVELVQSKGGILTMDDLAAHTSTPCDPISVSYGGLDVWEHPPNGQGIVALITLALLQHLQDTGKIRPISEMDHNSSEYLHVLIECLRIAFADGRYHVTDPERMETTVEHLLSKDYIAKRAEIFDPTRARADVKHGSPANSSDTVYFSVVDAQGNACSFIISNYEGFGTAAVPKGCGFTLQNRGSNFVLQEGHVNCVDGSKRPYHTIIPAMVTKGGDLWACYGVMGAFMQPQGQVQVLNNMLHFRQTPQAALDAPRICVGAVLPDLEAGWIDQRVYIEEGVSHEVLEELRKMGHGVEYLEGFARGRFGRGQVIRRHVVGGDFGGHVLSGGSDPRGDGAALPCS